MKSWPWLVGVAAVLMVFVLFFWATGFLGGRAPEPDPAVIALEPLLAETEVIVPLRRDVLTLWCYGLPDEEQALERRLNQFRDLAGEAVDVKVFSSRAAYEQARLQAFDAGQAPDVFCINANEAESLNEREWLRRLDFSGEAAEGWMPQTLAPFQRDDAAIAIPSGFSLLVLFYNMDLFDRKGMAYPGDHWKWQFLIGISKALYNPPVSERIDPVYGVEMPLSFAWWNALSGQAGGFIYNGPSWRLGQGADGEAQARALRLLNHFFRELAVAAPPETASEGEYFMRGKAAMLVAGADILRALQFQDRIRWGVSVLPRDPKAGTALRVNAWSVAKETTRPILAAQLALFLAEEPLHRGWVPALKDEALLLHSPKHRVFYDELRVAAAPPRFPFAVELEAFVNRRLNEWARVKDPNMEVIFGEVNAFVESGGNLMMPPESVAEKPDP